MALPAERRPDSVLTGGDLKQKHLYYPLEQAIATADGIDIVVSFLMESGVRMLLEPLKKARGRGARIRILTGNYLGITQPSALCLVRQALGDGAELRFYNEKDRSFHPKSYFFHFADRSEIFIGSSNLSRSALTSGIEWNYRFSSRSDPASYEEFYRTFEELFYHHAFVIDDEELRRYSKSWHCPAASRELEKYDGPDTDVRVLFEPRGAQIEALCALENTRAEGAKRALVMAATGVGKTYLAAFDSRKFRRVLFVAHREEILRQAAQAFRNVRQSNDVGFFLGEEKSIGKAVICASVATLGRSEYLSRRYFAPDDFDYIVIDEFHHAVNRQYRQILDYFRPKFVLGLTATPDRLDGRSIYELCDYNVAYEIPLAEAINKGMLAPFRYYGIYDETDYSSLRPVRGHYDEQELNAAYIGNAYRNELILKYYRKYEPRRALGFCCSRAHAEEMAGEFSRRGIPSAAVYSGASGPYSMDRAEAVDKLKRGEVRVIFSVDMFNEGVDIPSVDMVMFLRPTESPVVFLQQLGRGLRRSPGKDHLTVLDFIGNYEKAGNVRSFLSGRAAAGSGGASGTPQELPDGCLVDFDMRLIDLFRQLDRRSGTIRERIAAEFRRVQDELGHRPSRLELFTYMEDEVYSRALEHAKDNPFRHYLDFLQEMGALTAEEETLCRSAAREFLTLLETTNMSRVYKMPVLEAFLGSGYVRSEVTEKQLLSAWKSFFSRGTNWKDLDRSLSYEGYCAISDKAHLGKILQMPVHFLLASGKGFFLPGEHGPLALRPDLEEFTRLPAFLAHMQDIIAYREMDYYQRRYAASQTEDAPPAPAGPEEIPAPPAAPAPEPAPTPEADADAALVWLPIVGEIAAGKGRVAEEDILGYLPISRRKLHPAEHGKYFYLLVDGDSMVNAGIHSGDAVLIRRSSVPRDGDIIAARYDGDRGTLKTLRRGKDFVTLQPQNEAYDPILVPVRDFENGSAGYTGVAVKGENVEEALNEAKGAEEIEKGKIL